MYRLIPWIAALVGTAIYHRYTLLSWFDVVQADAGDSRFIAFSLEHWNLVAHGVTDWASPLIFFPVRGTLGYSDALFGMGIVHVALRAAGLPVFTAMNVQLVLWTLATFAAAYWFLARGFNRSLPAATIGAYFYAFSWPRFAELVHVQLQFMAPLPILSLLLLECLRDGPALGRGAFAWRAMASAVLLWLLFATVTYYGEFFLLFLSIALLLSLAHAAARRSLLASLRRHWAGGIAAAVLFCVLMIPVVRLYLPIAGQSGGRSWHDVTPFLLTPIDYLWLGGANWVWGWLFQRMPELAAQKWPGDRLGIGLVATCGWLAACIWAVGALVTSPKGGEGRPDRQIAAVLIVTALVVQLSALRVGSVSPWWLFYEAFPGMSGIRAIGRIQLVASLAIALGFATLTDLLLSRARPRWLLATAIVVVGVGALEQMGMAIRYSGRDAMSLSAGVAALISPDCKATYVAATDGAVPKPPIITDEALFDAKAYLLANPDVAANWTESAWRHYVLHGRAEGRYLSLDQTIVRQDSMFFYNHTIELAADITGKPLVNGLSGWQPPGWDLFDVFAANAPERLAQWLARTHQNPSDVCLVRTSLDWSKLPILDTPR